MDPKWIEQGGFLAVIAILIGALYYFKAQVDMARTGRDKDAEMYRIQAEKVAENHRIQVEKIAENCRIHADKLRVEYMELLRDVLKTISQNTLAIDGVTKALDITQKLEKLANGFKESK